MVRPASIAVVLSALLIPASLVSAAPLALGELPADTRWVIHLDLEAARATPVGKTFHARCLSTDAAQAKIEKIRKEIGIDPTKDLLSITAYDHQFARHQGVLLLRATKLDKEKLLAGLKKKHPDHQISEHGTTKLYTWTAHKKGKHAHQVTGAILGDQVLILSRNPDQVRAALDQLDGKGDSVSKDSPLAAATAEGTVLIARGIGMKGEETPFRLSVIRNADSLAISAGQTGDDVFVKVTLVTESTDVAQQYRAVAEGFQALAGLRAKEGDAGAALRRVVQGLKVTTADRTITANWKAAPVDVRAVVKNRTKKWGWGGKNCRPHSNPKKSDGDSDEKASTPDSSDAKQGPSKT